MNPALVVVTAQAVHVPGAGPDGLAGPDGPDGVTPMCDADGAAAVLGRKGLLYKEPATRLALCAVQRALGLPPGPVPRPLPGAAGTAVVASSNFGNLETVCDIAATAARESYRDVSPLATPNVSSNVIASTVALRFGFTGANIMLCNGATSGLDALRVGVRLIRAGRASRVVVVGTEASDATAAALAGQQAAGTAAATRTTGPALRAAAACVVLSRPPEGATGPWVAIDSTGVTGTARGTVPSPPGALLLVPSGQAAGHPGAAEVIDLTAQLGDTHGAHGVLQVAMAAARLAAGTPEVAVAACGDDTDGYAWAGLRRLECVA